MIWPLGPETAFEDTADHFPQPNLAGHRKGVRQDRNGL